MEGTRLIFRNFEIDEESQLFQLFFLRNNEELTVEVEEVKEIDFRKVKERIDQGESVFITLKHRDKMEKRIVDREKSAETWYFTRV